MTSANLTIQELEYALFSPQLERKPDYSQVDSQGVWYTSVNSELFQLWSFVNFELCRLWSER